MRELSLQGVLYTFPLSFRSSELEKVISLLIHGSVADCPTCVNQLLEEGYLLNYCPACQSIRLNTWVKEVHDLAQRYLDGKSVLTFRSFS